MSSKVETTQKQADRKGDDDNNTKGKKGGQGYNRQDQRNKNYRAGGEKKNFNNNNNNNGKEESKEENNTGDVIKSNNDNEKQNVEKKPRKQYKEKIIVTLETVIPELPKKSERLNEPDSKFYDAEYDRLQKEIENVYTKMQDMIKTERQKLGLSTKESFNQQKSLRDMLSAKQSELQKVQAELSTLREQMDQARDALEDYYDKSNKYRQKMKIIMPREKMASELKRLKDLQAKGNITLFEEKKIVREIGDLEVSLPYAEPLEKLEVEFASIKEKKKTVGAELKKKIEIKDRLRAEEKDLRKILDQKKEEGAKIMDEKEPGIEKIREEYRGQIRELKKQVKDLERKEKEEWDKYYEQQDLIKQIQWMKKVQDRLKRDQERKLREEEERKQRELEEAQYKEVLYKEEMDLCELLINYCQKLLPQEKATVEENTESKDQILKKALESDDWKKEKVQLIVSKRDREEDYFPGKQKKNKNKKPQQQQQDTNANIPLNHQMEILGYFDHIKVAPPLFNSKLQDSIKLLKEKKDYYQARSEAEQNNTKDQTTEKNEETVS